MHRVCSVLVYHLPADLRSLQRGTYQSPRHQSPAYSPRPPSPRDDKIKPPPAQHTAFGESTYARGGHGIFGQPKVGYLRVGSVEVLACRYIFLIDFSLNCICLMAVCTPHFFRTVIIAVCCCFFCLFLFFWQKKTKYMASHF